MFNDRLKTINGKLKNKMDKQIDKKKIDNGGDCPQSLFQKYCSIILMSHITYVLYGYDSKINVHFKDKN